MRTGHVFLIESRPSFYRLSVDGDGIGTFPTLDAAKSMAAAVAQRYVPAATLNFELDFKSTISDWEVRAAVLERPSSRQDKEHQNVDR